jgi:hypothetical protein
LEKLHALSEQKSARLNETVLKSASANILHIEYLKKFGTPDVPVLNRVRGYAYLFLLLFNGSVSEDTLTFYSERKEVPLDTLYIVAYPNDIKNKFTENQIIEIIRAGREDFKYVFWEDILKTLFPI